MKGFNCIVSLNMLFGPFHDSSLNQLGSMAERCINSTSGVWGGAPDANDFSAFWNIKEAFGAI